MISERIYRFLLVVYPREYRREYGELMVQLFRDRMRRDGDGIRGLVVWIQMLKDLIGSAFIEPIEGVIMTKRRWFGFALAVFLAMAAAGLGTIYAMYGDDEKMTVTVMTDTNTKTISGEGTEDFAEAIRQAVEEGAISQEFVDEIAGLVDEGNKDVSESLRGVFAKEDFRVLKGGWTDGLDEVMRRMEAAEADAREAGERMDKLIESLEGEDSSRMWRYEGGPGGLVEAVRSAVEEGELSQELADMILESLSDSPVGG